MLTYVGVIAMNEHTKETLGKPIKSRYIILLLVIIPMIFVFFISDALSDLEGSEDMFNQWQVLLMSFMGMYAGMMIILILNKNNIGRFRP